MYRIVLFMVAATTLACSTPTNAVAQSKAKSKSTLVCPLMPMLMDQYLESHTLFDDYNDTLQARTVEAWSERLDPNEVLLTQSEWEATLKSLEDMVGDVRKEKCEGFEWLHEQQIAWHTDMEAFATKLLSDKKLTIDETIELQLDPDERDRPKDKEAQADLRTRILHLQLANYVKGGVTLEEAKEKLIARYTRTRKRYEEMEETDLYEDFLDAWAHSMDPHSAYFSADDLEDFRISMELSLEGIGALLGAEDGLIIVREVIPGGAAAREGTLKAEDKIIAVSQGKDGEPTQTIDMPLSDVVRMIRGEKGTTVKLTVLRKAGKTKTLDILIVRDKISLEEQAANIRWEKRERDGKSLKLAVIELPSFYGGRNNPDAAIRDVEKLLLEAKEGNADGVLFDLSRNGGGLLTAAVDIAGLFIAEGPIVGVSGRTQPTDILSDKHSDIVWDGPLVVLTSRASASASEIVAGALQDYSRALIVGDDQTFGKGTVQQLSPLPAGLGAVKVTTSMFYLPEGESTQSGGVPSDIVVPSVLNTPEFGENKQTNALPADTIKSFEGTDANPKTGGYTPVSSKIIKTLAKQSRVRVAKSDAFKEVAEALEKRKVKAPLKLSEVLDDKDDEDEKDDDKKDADKKDDAPKELSPQADEALNILADMVVTMN